jgi:hypothetical protein
MKHILKYCILILAISNSYSQTNNIIGKWENIGIKNSINGFEFKSDNTAVMYDDKNEASPIFTLKMDYGKNPIWLDMQLEKNGMLVEFYGLVEFKDAKTINLKIYRGHYEVHPVSFSESSRSEVLFTLKKME